MYKPKSAIIFNIFVKIQVWALLFSINKSWDYPFNVIIQTVIFVKDILLQVEFAENPAKQKQCKVVKPGSQYLPWDQD